MKEELLVIFVINFCFSWIVCFRSHDSGDSSKILSPVRKLEIKDEKKEEIVSDSPKVPAGVDDFDKENLLDPIQVSNYAMEIFEYMKQREKCFQVDNYMSRQVCFLENKLKKNMEILI